jgi:MarR family transcriptional regulator, 2-MHQ and catechol-resistance regulon repressor
MFRMTKQPAITAAKLWTILAKAHRALSTQVEASVARHGLCLSDFMALEVLLHKGPLTVGEIGFRVLLTSGSMTAAVDRLERRGLARREFAEEDRRARVIHLTSKGERLVKAVFEAHSRDLENLMGALDSSQRVQLYELLKKLGLSAAAASHDSDALSHTGRKRSNAADQKK